MTPDFAVSHTATPSHARLEKLMGLFERALDLPEGPQRDAWLTATCASEPALATDLRRLLDADSDVRRRASTAATNLPRFGIYQARELVGSGGMGAVYRATREDGEVRQEVAVKVMSAVLWSPGAEDRFRRERQILAELQHPNVARFLDGGVTETGAPYLVMEFVKGQRIDHWCDGQRLSLRNRLELLLNVCHAVSFAHQKLIVHRDLKPANVLVDGNGEPKLLDFGIARTLEPEASAGIATPTVTMAFTPRYASPEQLRGETSGVSCDVYSLGVLLFELLSGASPYGGNERTPSGMIARVLSAEAGLPSASAPETSEAAAARGLSSPAALRRQLRGDLDAIVTKAIAKEPSARYPSVEQFAEDIRRYLDGLPVLAAPTGALYRARKFIQRHRTGVVAAALIAITIIAGITATLWQANAARQERVAAERRFNVARALAQYLVFNVQPALERLPSSTPLRAEIINRSLAYLDQLAAEKSNDAALQVELGHGYFALADVLGAPWRPNLGQTAKARETYRKAIAMLQPVVSRNPTDRLARLYLSRSKAMLGRSLEFASDSAEGRKLQQEGAEESLQLAHRWPGDFDVRANAGLIWYGWARTLLTGAGFFTSAENAGPATIADRHSIDNYEAALRLKPGDLESIRQLANCYSLMGYITDTQDIVKATPYFREALTVLDRMSPTDRQSTIGRETRGNALLALGSNLAQLGQYREAIAMVDEARGIRDRLAADDPQNRGARVERYYPHEKLGELEELAGQPAAALQAYLIAIKMLDDLVTENPRNRNLQLVRADAQEKAAHLSAKFGRMSEADRLNSAALSFFAQADARPQAAPQELMLGAQLLMDTPITRLRNATKALAFMKRAEQQSADDPDIQQALAQAYWMNGDRAHAIQAVKKALSLVSQTPTPQRADLTKLLDRYQSARLP